jgi:hypothetical protein
VKALSSGSGVAFLTDLKKYRKYGVVIQAFNEKGPGPMSAEIVAQTLEDGEFSKYLLLLCYNLYYYKNLVESRKVIITVMKLLCFSSKVVIKSSNLHFLKVSVTVDSIYDT